MTPVVMGPGRRFAVATFGQGRDGGTALSTWPRTSGVLWAAKLSPRRAGPGAAWAAAPMQSTPKVPSTVSRFHRPAGAVPRARRPRGARPYRYLMLVIAPRLSRNASRPGLIPPTPAASSVRHAGRAHATSSRSCSAARSVCFPAPLHARQRPVHCGQVDRNPGLLSQPLPALRQGQVVGPLQRPPQHRLRLRRHLGPDMVAHLARRAPPVLPQRPHSVLHRRATHRKPPGHSRHRLACLNRHQHPLPQVR